MLADRVDPRAVRDLVESFPAPRSRLHRPDAMAAMDRLVLEGFRSRGWTADIRPFEFRDAAGYEDLGTLRHGRWGPTTYGHLAGANVVASRAAASNETVVVVAHHDTPRDLPGADDNGAAIAVLLELARLLSADAFARRVVLAAVDMEEIGLFGSRVLVDELMREGPVVAALTMDTMAYSDGRPGSQLLPPGFGLLFPRVVARLRRDGLRANWTGILYRGSSRAIAERVGRELEAVAGPGSAVLLRDPADLPLVGRPLQATLPMVREFARSDHRSFWNAGIPAVVLTDTTYFRNPHYHELTDRPDTLDYDRVAAITLALAATVRELAA